MIPVTWSKHQFRIINIQSLLKIEVLVSEKNLKVYLKLIFAPHPFWAKWENQRSEKLNIGCTPHGINFARSKYYTFLDENLFNSPVHFPDKKIIHWFWYNLLVKKNSKKFWIWNISQLWSYSSQMSLEWIILYVTCDTTCDRSFMKHEM